MTSERLARVHTVLDELHVDAVLIASPANRCYLTGFSGDLGGNTTRDVVLVHRGGATLLTYPIHTAWASSEVVPGIDVIGKVDWLASAAEVIEREGWTMLAIDDTALPHAAAVKLREALPDTVGVVLLGNRLAGLRARKETPELEAMRVASAITDRVLTEAAGWLDVGMTERGVARRIKETFYRLGADDLAFDVIVASGPNAAKPHHRPTDRAMAEGDAVVVDLGCRLDRYCSDLTRTLSVGPPTERFATLYNATLAARDAAVRLVEPGRPASEVATAAGDVLRGLGLGDLLMHGLGHGVGLQVHEAPAINETSEDVLAVGDVFSVEPGVYDPGWGGVRTEDVVVVTDDGCETITTAPTLDLGRGA